MKNDKIWGILEGRVIYSCVTRKQAREKIKKLRAEAPCVGFFYLVKEVRKSGKHSQIIIDL